MSQAHPTNRFKPLWKAFGLLACVGLLSHSNAKVAISAQGNGMCSASVTEALSSYVKGNTTLGLMSLSLDDALSPMLNGQDYQLEFSKKALLNYVHFVFKGENGPRVVSYAFKKNGDYAFSQVNQFKSDKIRWNLFNPLLRGEQFCPSSRAAAKVARAEPMLRAEPVAAAEETPPEAVPERNKGLRFFRDSTEYHENAKTTRMGIERDIGPNSVIRVGSERETTEGAPENNGIGISFSITTDGFRKGFFKRNKGHSHVIP